MSETPTLQLTIRDNSEKAAKGLERLAASLSELKEKLNTGLNLDRISTDLEKLHEKLETAFSPDTAARVTHVAEALEKLSRVKDIRIPDLNKSMPSADFDIGNLKPENSAIGVFQETAESASATTEELDKRIEAVNQKLYGSSGQPELDKRISDLKTEFEALNTTLEQTEPKVADASDAIKQVAGSANKAKKEIDGKKESVKGLGDSLNKVISPLDKLVKAFSRIMLFRTIRNVLKHISQGFKEGLENVRAYSKAINGSFNKAMVSMDDTMLKLKNTLGAALAPAFEALIPYVQMAVNWFIELMNIVNQFVALITGKETWTHAIDASSEAIDGVGTSATGAAKKVKELLAGFDELNIIQSESGGGGSGAGSKPTIDYTTMFEEVDVFDGKIRDAVNFLKENFDTIKTVAAEIAAAIIGWKVSTAFSGIVSKLGKFVLLGALIKLTWDIITFFDDKYFQTGDIGFLIGNIMTTVVGSYLGKIIAEQVIGKGAGDVAVPVVLAVSALADIVSSLRHVDVAALSKENIINTILASLKLGTAVGIIAAKFFNFTTAEAFQIGGGAALLTFGAAIGLKAVIQAIDTKDFGEDYLRAKVLSGITGGIGGGLMIGKALRLGTVGTIMTAAGTGLLLYGVMTGVEAIATAVESEDFTKENLEKTVEASLETAFAAGLIVKGIGGTGAQTAWTGGGVLLTTVGVVAGVQAVARAVKVGYDDGFYANLALSSLGIGAGSAMLAMALGAKAGVAGIVGGLAVLTTVGVIVGVSAILQANQSDITWGDVSLTQQQIQSYVNSEKFFTIDVSATINLVKSKVEADAMEKAGLRAQVTLLFGEINSLRLGIDVGTSLANIQREVFGSTEDGSDKTSLLGRITKLSEGTKAMLKTTFGLMPVYDSEGKDVTAETLLSGITGWSMLEQGMQTLGQQLSNILIDSSTGQLKTKLTEYEQTAVTEILGTMTRVTQAVTSGQINAEINANFRFGLSDLTEESFGEVFKLFGDYKKELETQYRNMYTQSAQTYLGAYNGFIELADSARKSGNEELAKQYEAQAEDMMKNYVLLMGQLDQTVEDAVNKASQPGYELLTNFIDDKFGVKIYDYIEELENSDFEGMFGSFDLLGDNAEYTAKEKAEEIAKSLTDDVAVAMGHGLEYGDAMRKAGISPMMFLPESIQTPMLRTIALRYGTDVAEEFAKAVGIKVPENLEQALIDASNEAVKDAMKSGKIDLLTDTGEAFIRHETLSNSSNMSSEELARRLRDDQIEAIRAQLTRNGMGNELAALERAGVDLMSLVPKETLETIITQYYETFGAEVAQMFAESVGLELPKEIADVLLAAQEAETARRKLTSVERRINEDAQAFGEGATPSKPKLPYNSVDQMKEFSDYQSSFVKDDGEVREHISKLLEDKERIETEISSMEQEIQQYEADLNAPWYRKIFGVEEDAKYNLFTNYYPESPNVGLYDRITTAKQELEKVSGELEQYGVTTEKVKETADTVATDVEETYKKLEEVNGLIEKYSQIYFHPTVIDLLFGGHESAEATLFGNQTGGGLFGRKDTLMQQLTELNGVLDELSTNFTTGPLGDGPKTPTPPNMTPFVSEVESAEKEVRRLTNDIRSEVEGISGLKIWVSFTGGAGGGNWNASNMFKADGGFVTTGDMFIAREAGPELVGRIGSRTAVANNDQIVSGVANGVAAGQSEQNALLRRQNDILVRLLNKDLSVKLTPNSGWGSFVKESAEMYAENTGY